MTAKGKINASKVQAGDRIIVQVADNGNVTVSSTKTGEGVQIARVTGKTYASGSQRRPGYYVVKTNAGWFSAAPIQTMWLAPEDNAGVKRAHVEALAEQADRWKAGLDEIWDEALAEDAERMAINEADAADAQDRAWAQHHGILIWSAEEWRAGRQADHAESLTLNSHAGKVDNMNNESATETQTQTAPAQNHTGSTVVSLLEKVWSRIREDHPELPEVVITTGSGEGVKWGHFRAESWKVRAEEGAAVSETKTGRRHELFLASEALAKGAHQVLQTMLHEGAHTLSRVRDVKDTSRQGRWHNATFRKTAEEMGLEHKGSAADKSHGFSFVTLTAATKARYADLLAELDREIRLTGLLPAWLGGTGDEDERGGERMTGKPTKGEGNKSGPLKATCKCEEPVIIRLSQKVLDLNVVRCDGCDSLFTAA